MSLKISSFILLFILSLHVLNASAREQVPRDDLYNDQRPRGDIDPRLVYQLQQLHQQQQQQQQQLLQRQQQQQPQQILHGQPQQPQQFFHSQLHQQQQQLFQRQQQQQQLQQQQLQHEQQLQVAYDRAPTPEHNWSPGPQRPERRLG